MGRYKELNRSGTEVRAFEISLLADCIYFLSFEIGYRHIFSIEDKSVHELTDFQRMGGLYARASHYLSKSFKF